jgi:hypothetical protein
MTCRTGDRGHAPHWQQLPLGVRSARTERGRGRSVVISALGAGTVAAAIMLASAPAYAAAAGVPQGFSVDATTPGQTGHGEMPGMDMSGSTPTPDGHGEMPGMDMSGSTPTPDGHGEMPGMEHGSGSTPEPTHSGEMPGMEHGSGDAPESGHESGDMPGMDHEQGGAARSDADRPLVPVLGTFGGAASAVLLSAGLMRRKDRADEAAKTAARAARRSGK